MKLIRNTGTDRVIDLLRPQLTAGRQCDIVTPAISLFAFSALLFNGRRGQRCYRDAECARPVCSERWHG